MISKKISRSRSKEAASSVVSALQQGSTLVRQCLVQQCPERDGKGNWRCSSCKLHITGSTHLAFHYCAHRPAWSRAEMKADQLLCNSNGITSCALCKQWVSEKKPHRCRNIALRLMLVDFSASSVAPLSSGHHNHECALKTLRSYGSHAGMASY
jgi:hypothetical protein